MKLFSRYNRINLTLIVIIFLSSSLFYYFLIHHILVGELEEQLDHYKNKIESYANETGKFPEPSVLESVQVTYEPTIKPVASAQHSQVEAFNPGKKRKRTFVRLTYIRRLGTQNFIVTLSKPIVGMHFLFRSLVYATITTLLIIILISFLLNIILLRKLWRPFYETIGSIKKFKLGKSNAFDLPATNIEEFDFLNRNLQVAFTDASNEYQLLKEFTENASHEIQTPLAIMRSKLDLVIQDESMSEKQSETLKSLYTNLKKLTKLNESLLLLTKIENKQFSDFVNIDLKAKIEEKLSQFEEFFESNHITVSATLTPAFINANGSLVDILLNNLIGNAGRHNKDGGKVEIVLNAEALIISNTGVNKELNKEKLFRRFYKETQNSHHNGLGLSIVKQICDQSGIMIAYTFTNNMHSFSLLWKK
ncbi:MAG TPA: HAMP domain-containing sensor histidine kinase [Bacteroidia bacterium]|jgi:signal transduction histidine kinase|nr:HAMP domain-containing sensor histidine kinase [Bacteroidia bacterium]